MTLPASTAARDALVRKGLKFSQLRLLAALRESGQIGAAAQQVGMSQPAASRLMAQFEDLLGTPLYTRHARGITLTDAGRIMAEQAVAALRDLDRSHERVRQAVLGARGHVRIGSVTGPSLELVLPLIRELRLAYPGIEISVNVDTSDKLAEALLSETLDFYIGRIPEGTDSRPFAISPIGEEPISLVVRLGHPLCGRADLTLEECLAYDWVTQPPGGLLRQTTEAYILARGHRLPERILGTSSTLFTLALTNETNAIAPLARAVADFFIERGALGSRLDRLPVAEDLAVKAYGIISRSDERLSPASDRVLAMLRAKVTGKLATPDPQG